MANCNHSTVAILEHLESRLMLSGDTVLPSHSLFNPNGYLTEASQEEPLDIAVDYLRSHADELGLVPADFDNFNVIKQYVSSTGLTHIYLRQTCNEQPIANTGLSITLKEGQLLSIFGCFVSGAGSQQMNQAYQLGMLEDSDAMLTEDQAIQAAAEQLGVVPASVSPDTGGPDDGLGGTFEYVADTEGTLTLCRCVSFSTTDGQHCYVADVDVVTGDLVLASDMVAGDSYRVYPMPYESPGEAQDSTLVTDPQNSTASSLGWLNTGTESFTQGNNADVQSSVFDQNTYTTSTFPTEDNSERGFNYETDLTGERTDYMDASATNAFYWVNVLHDIHYAYGFDEAAGNFQQTNLTGQESGGDPMMVVLEYNMPVDYNNARSQYGVDGDPAQITLPEFIITSLPNTSPRRESALDATIICHEYGHGVSRRLTFAGDVQALDANQSLSMYEGWSDWWGLMFTQDGDDQQSDPYYHAAYLYPDGINNNPYPGDRRSPYSYDMEIDPLTFADYNTGHVAHDHTSADPNSEAHNAGEIWTSALWDMNWLLIQKYNNGVMGDLAGGYHSDNITGNTLAMQLVEDALAIQPANPSFIDARNAILMADVALNDGRDLPEIWEAFARRGLGTDATLEAGGTANDTDLIQGFNAIPSGNDDSAITDQCSSVIINVLGNDTDPNTADVLKINGYSSPSHGAVTSNGFFVCYKPVLTFSGQDTFEYTVSDGKGGLSTASVTVTVIGGQVATGALTSIGTYPRSGYVISSDVVVSPNSMFVYSFGPDLQTYNGVLKVFHRNPVSGVLDSEPLAEYVTDGWGTKMAISPDGNSMYVVNMMNDSISWYGVNQGTGELTLLQTHDFTQDGVGCPDNVVVGPDGQSVYVTGFTYPDFHTILKAYHNDGAGNLTVVSSVTNSNWDVDCNTVTLTISPDGKNLYMNAFMDSSLWIVNRDTSDGSLSGLRRYLDAATYGIVACDISPDGQYVYIGEYGSSVLKILARDDGTGDVTPYSQSTVQYVVRPWAIVASLDGNFVFVADDDGVVVFRRSPLNGELYRWSSIACDIGGTEMALSPDGRSLYITADDDLLEFRIDSPANYE